MDLEKRFGLSLEKIGLGEGAVCLVALSGGGDSVALLELLSRESKRRSITIYAARISHGIRRDDEEKEEIDLCRCLCLNNNITFYSIDVSDEIQNQETLFGCGPEQAARTARHMALEKLSEKLKADAILFGHTADDQIETVMMRLLSGAGPEGLKGIAGRRGRIYRPLLFASRVELRQFLEKNEITWAEDRTNDEDCYRRNRVRNELLPLVSEIFPGWPSALIALSERSGEASDALEAATRASLPPKIRKGMYSWDEEDWLNAPYYLKALSVWNAVDYLDDSGVPDLRIPWKTVKSVIDAVDNGQKWESYGLVAENGTENIMIRRVESPIHGRFILHHNEAQCGFEAVLADRRILVSPRQSDHKNPKPLNQVAWPLVINFSIQNGNSRYNTQSITEKSSMQTSTDADKEIFYISIDRVFE